MADIDAKKVELLPCPFCGGHRTEPRCDGERAWIECLTCQTQGPAVTNEDLHLPLLDVAEAAWNRRASLAERGEERGWMDISTAPKDGDVHILVAVTGGPHGPCICEAYWHLGDDRYDPDWWFGADSPGRYDASPITDVVAGVITHWQPLPAPPAAIRAGGSDGH